jgi:hypothetical protein
VTQIKVVSAYDTQAEADRELEHYLRLHRKGDIDLVKTLQGTIDLPVRQLPKDQPGISWQPKPKRETRHIVVAIYRYVSRETQKDKDHEQP